MKKLIALIATISILITMTGCGTNDDVIPPAKDYVAIAKEHGYWRGLGGISWGMSIDETLAVLNVKREDVTITEEEITTDTDPMSSTFVSIDSEFLGLPAEIKMEFSKATHPDVGVLSEKEWLMSIRATFEETQTKEEMSALIQEELKTLGLSYDEQKGKNEKYASRLENKQTLQTLNNKTHSEEAFKLYEQFMDKLSYETLIRPGTSPMPIDDINLFYTEKSGDIGATKISEVSAIMLTGFTAAILAKSY